MNSRLDVNVMKGRFLLPAHVRVVLEIGAYSCCAARHGARRRLNNLSIKEMTLMIEPVNQINNANSSHTHSEDAPHEHALCAKLNV